MIKLENVVLASPEQMEFIIEGMRNPMNSWDKSDSNCCAGEGFGQCRECGHSDRCMYNGDFYLGDSDHSLMQRLSNAGTDHRKFMRMMPVYVRITAPLYWWKEFDTYKVGTVSNSLLLRCLASCFSCACSRFRSCSRKSATSFGTDTCSPL